jgi:glycosyl hydrolase family 2
MKRLFVFLLLTASASAQSGVGTFLRASLNLNGTWSYVVNQSQNQIPTTGWAPARVPAAPFMDGTASVWYKKSIFVPATWVHSGRSFFLELEKCGHYCAIYANGQIMGQHYGQYSPYEVEVTSAIVGGQDNEFEIYVHDADSTYAHSGPPIDQSSCPPAHPNCKAMSYRPSGLNDNDRNWVGIVGDITLSWRGTNGEYVSGAQIITSVRQSTLTANLSVVGAGTNATVSASVLDAGVDVLDIPAQPVIAGSVSLVAKWTNPTLWQPGQPKLYTLRTTLVDGQTDDQRFDRFGFREVWIQGREVLLNGSPLWMAGDYLAKDTPLRFSNDRRPIAMQLDIQQKSGLNADTFHWDDPGRNYYDLRDEMGIPSMAAMYCTGAPDTTDSKVDDRTTWTQWMQGAAAEVALAEQNRPSIMFWRPVDLTPAGAGVSYVDPLIKSAMLAVNPTFLFADSTDIDTWAQSVVSQSNPNTCDDGSAFAAQLASETKPLIIRELYGFTSMPCDPTFLSTIYQIAYQGGAVGLYVEHLGLFAGQEFSPVWPSQSGIGNRPASSEWLPNWMTREWSPESWSTEFAGLWTQYTGTAPVVGNPVDGEYVAPALPLVAGTAFLEPPSGTGIPVGVATARSSPSLTPESVTADLFTSVSGNNVLTFANGSGDTQEKVTAPPPAPF